jgi:hypothetical protein
MFGCSPVSVRLVYPLSVGVVLADTSLLLSVYGTMENLLDDQEDLYTFFGFSLQEVVKTVTFIARPAQVELWRDPPVVNIDLVFCHVDRPAEVPEIIALR